MVEPTIVVDPEDGGTQAGERLPTPPGFKRTPICEQMGSPIHPDGECCVLDGRPCILFGMQDYAEDWSGEFVREIHPFTLIGAPKVAPAEFWQLVASRQDRADSK